MKFPTHTLVRSVMFTALIFAGPGAGLAEAGPQDDGAGEGNSRPTVLVGTIEGAIGPVTKNYVHRVLEAARAESPACVIFTIDTPGGLDASMRSIIKDILSSPVPVVTYVFPSGARAASAGALISLSAHIAAMAPSTNIGAAHPVSLGGGQADSTMMAKITNDAAAFARGLAQDRGRDVEWAEKIVRESISSTEDEVLELGVIEIIATDIEDLIEQLDGRTVEVNGSPYEINTRDASITAIHPTFREEFLALVERYDPTTAAAITGIDEDTIRQVARLYARAGAAMTIWTMGINQSTHGSDGVCAINNLNLITGNIGKPGGTSLSITGQCNAMGTREWS
ncbi:MAG: molybdopterin-dependent oxidoreductase, partial [bacterium]|nr:molybdopterin-dependent oxidoreductase [bacterium]